MSESEPCSPTEAVLLDSDLYEVFQNQGETIGISVFEAFGGEEVDMHLLLHGSIPGGGSMTIVQYPDYRAGSGTKTVVVIAGSRASTGFWYQRDSSGWTRREGPGGPEGEAMSDNDYDLLRYCIGRASWDMELSQQLAIL